MLGPLPSLLAAPSIWYDAVLVPNRNPGGNESVRTMPPIGLCFPHRHNLSDERGDPSGNGPIRRPGPGATDAARVLVRPVTTTPDHVSFGPMVCHDDHLLGEGAGFDDHPHSDLVIVSWVVSGAVRHTGLRPGRPPCSLPGDVGVLRTGVRGGAQRVRRGAADPVRPGLAHRPGARWRDVVRRVVRRRSRRSPGATLSHHRLRLAARR